WAYDGKGAMAPFDGPALAAAKIRVSQLNAKGGVGGRHFVIKTCDTQNNKPAISKACADKLLAGGANILFTTCDVDFAAPAVQEGVNKGVLAGGPRLRPHPKGAQQVGAEGQL